MGVKEDWAGFDRALCKRINAPVVIFDNRGIGESDVPTTPYSIALFVEDLKTVVDAALGKVPHDILGISMGGCITMAAALTDYPLLRRIIIGCSTPGGPEAKLGNGLMSCMSAFTDDTTKNLPHREQVIKLQRYNLPAAWIEAHSSLFEQYITDVMRSKRSAKGIIQQMKALIRFNVSKTVANIKIPTFIIHGELDDMVPLQSGQLLLSKIKTSQMFEIKGAAHLFWISHLGDAVRATSAFLNQPYSQLQHGTEASSAATTTSTSAAQKAKL